MSDSSDDRDAVNRFIIHYQRLPITAGLARINGAEIVMEKLLSVCSHPPQRILTLKKILEYIYCLNLFYSHVKSSL